MSDLVAPFPYFGGKRTIAAQVWARLGNVTNYVEPFFGSGAVLLSRPHPGKIETINDKDRFVANFWRAAQHDPEEVAHHLSWPVNECDLSARHGWLLGEGARRIVRCEGDPAFYDVQVAGWWAWGMCAWIGSGWCSGEGPWSWNEDTGDWRKLPHLGNAGRGIKRKLPHLGTAGQGINRQLPHLGGSPTSIGIGINGRLGRGNGALLTWITALADRLRHVRVCCGDWERVCGPSVTHRHGLTGVFLDPPYADTAGRTEGLYSTDSLTVAHDAREWAIAEGRNPLMRIVFAGYEGEHVFPRDWPVERWKARGGFGSQGDDIGRANCGRERLWYSPACLSAVQPDLLAMLADTFADVPP